MSDASRHSTRRGGLGDAFLTGLGLHILFFLARHAAWLLRLLRPMWVEWCWRIVRPVRRSLLENAGYILGPEATKAHRTHLARGVVAQFYRFVMDCGRGTAMTREELVASIVATEGIEQYHAARASRKGAVIVTAHLGSFEVGLAGLAEREREIHVIFQRDAYSRFERVRSLLRARLGVHEHAIEEGWPMWVGLRDILRNDGVVMMQGDRVMPGQKGIWLPFLHGRIEAPTGPVRLAALAGCPIIPVFAIREADEAVRIHIEPPIEIDATPGQAGIEKALRDLAAVTEKYVAIYPDQWLMIHRVFRNAEEH